VSSKSSRETAGVNALVLKSKNTLYKADFLREDTFKNPDFYRTKNIPAAGCFLKQEDREDDQISM
jgi:DNA gyrase subunit A